MSYDQGPRIMYYEYGRQNSPLLFCTIISKVEIWLSEQTTEKVPTTEIIINNCAITYIPQES